MIYIDFFVHGPGFVLISPLRNVFNLHSQKLCNILSEPDKYKILDFGFFLAKII